MVAARVAKLSCATGAGRVFDTTLGPPEAKQALILVGAVSAAPAAVLVVISALEATGGTPRRAQKLQSFAATRLRSHTSSSSSARCGVVNAYSGGIPIRGSAPQRLIVL